ncbi:MAG: M28 family peptidase [Blastocatellia bacterium]
MSFQTVARRAVWGGALILLMAMVGGDARVALSQSRAQSRAKRKAPAPKIAPDVQAALNRISADSLRGHLSFIASDLLEGRGTPSRGLDIAAEYIAAQFRRAGLEPAGDDGYFQTANWSISETPASEFHLAINDGQQTINTDIRQVSFASDQKLDLNDLPMVKLDYQDKATIEALQNSQVEKRVVLAEIPDLRRADRSRRGEMALQQSQFLSKVKTLGAAFVVSIDRNGESGQGVGSRRLFDENRRAMGGGGGAQFLTIHGARFAKLFDAMKTGEATGSFSLRAPAAVEKPIKLKNVIGVLRGSDPALKDTYVLVTAHYDHVGMGTAVNGDGIFNGANDDGSGTVSVIELASALSTLKQRPKRSIVFMTVFGEERGLLGSRYYGRHPVFPIEKTVADINLEHVGRTDDTEGPRINRATLTGFDYTDVGEIFKTAGAKTGIEVYKHEKNSDSFFGRSDNQALADQGVPAHTLCVAFIFPDYHGLGDHWDKIDYANMARVNRMVALALVTIANSDQEPKWNEANPKTEKYVKAWKALRSKRE